jgi:hypothetical protein
MVSLGIPSGGFGLCVFVLIVANSAIPKQAAEEANIISKTAQ